MALESRVEAVRVVARTLRQFGGQDQVAVGVLDVDRALGYLSPINYERRYPPLRKSITVHESGATPDGPQKANDHFDQTRLSVLEHPHLLFQWRQNSSGSRYRCETLGRSPASVKRDNA